jgi:DNA-binding GntR family transcriptional regulator
MDSDLRQDGRADHGLNQRVQQRLLELISSGEIAAGAKITEASMAERLGVSRGPVREAFRALEESGLLVNERNRGVFVRSISPGEAAELQEVRSALDELAARRAAQRMTPHQIQTLRGFIDQMDEAAKAGDVSGFYALNLRFHEFMVGACGNAKLLTTYRRLIMELHLYREAGLRPDGEMAHSNAAHRTILNRIALGDAHGAAEAMRDHTAHGRQRILLGQPAD